MLVQRRIEFRLVVLVILVLLLRRERLVSLRDALILLLVVVGGHDLLFRHHKLLLGSRVCHENRLLFLLQRPLVPFQTLSQAIAAVNPLGVFIEVPLGGEGLGALSTGEALAISTITAGHLEKK